MSPPCQADASLRSSGPRLRWSCLESEVAERHPRFTLPDRGSPHAPARTHRDTALERMARELVPTVERAAGVEFRRPPRLTRAGRATLERFLSRQLAEDLPPEQARAWALQAAYAHFGLIPDTLNLRVLVRDLYLEQVVEYYDPAADTLFVWEEVSEGEPRTVLVHEMVHALQDQHTDLDSVTEAWTVLNDPGMAARAAINRDPARLPS